MPDTLFILRHTGENFKIDALSNKTVYSRFDIYNIPA